MGIRRMSVSVAGYQSLTTVFGASWALIDLLSILCFQQVYTVCFNRIDNCL